MHTDAAFAFIERLHRQRDIAALLTAFQATIQGLGFDSYCMGDPTQPHVLRPDRVWATSWPEGWIKRYAEQQYQFSDPVLRRLQQSAEPFRWRDVRDEAGPEGLQVLEDASTFGLKDGFTLPIHGPRGGLVGVSFSTAHYEATPREEAALRMAALYFHARLARLRGPGAAAADGAKLTPRERECLSWVAAGKTDWEISQILSISEQTAHEHVQNTLGKLKAATRAQAVAVAMLNRQILQ